jgi:hypothetical protein
MLVIILHVLMELHVKQLEAVTYVFVPNSILELIVKHVRFIWTKIKKIKIYFFLILQRFKCLFK